MLLKDKVAVIYGASGAVGSATARAFAREGATVFLAARTLAPLDALAKEITDAGGNAYSGQVDALDKNSVENHLNDVIRQAGKIDISYNLIPLGDEQGEMLVNMRQVHFTTPIFTAMNTHFLTMTAAARHMSAQGSGVILALTANVARRPSSASGGFGVACAAIEGLCRQLAVEAGQFGVRVVCLRSAGSPDTPGVREAMQLHADKQGVSLEQFLVDGAQSNMLRKHPMLPEVANVAVIMASDYAGVVTAAVTNVTCGELAD